MQLQIHETTTWTSNYWHSRVPLTADDVQAQHPVSTEDLSSIGPRGSVILTHGSRAELVRDLLALDEYRLVAQATGVGLHTTSAIVCSIPAGLGAAWGVYNNDEQPTPKNLARAMKVSVRRILWMLSVDGILAELRTATRFAGWNMGMYCGPHWE
ncbi:hypothetical protein DAEQUDRAFT_607409 [Daedalea quercina L-15889]|uniref:Uncharacterized protein n=1 Tax=Daedalea quercina L-15889 TaxID=1314783 RepID=A0A165LHV5_9APHY|nr:hypothetical protein DAEQUDRAFT_607409 [Daedalea quercina L-15889]